MAVTGTHFPFRIDVRTATARALSIVDCADDCAALPVGLLRVGARLPSRRTVP